MTPEQALREKLRKIEALFAGAATQGERVAAGSVDFSRAGNQLRINQASARRTRTGTCKLAPSTTAGRCD